jgi:ribosomal protein L3 glutamine methyltransferase
MTSNLEAGTSVADALVIIEKMFIDAGLSYGHGMGCAVDEAAHLIAHVIAGAPTVTTEMMPLILTEPQVERLSSMTAARIELRRPAAYLTGEAWFAGIRFEIDERVIVPRSPIAALLAEAFAPWVDADNVESVLDLCAGSGCIAMVSAMVFPDASVDAAELSIDALAVAEQNRARLELTERVSLIQSDLYSGLTGRRYDLIISNPPYVPVKRQMPDEYGHEPDMALFAGNDGLDLAWPILAGAIDHLTPEGWLVLEVGEAMDQLVHTLPELPATWVDLYGDAIGVMIISRSELLSCELQLRELAAGVGSTAG